MRKENDEMKILLNINKNIEQATGDIRRIMIANVIMMLLLIAGAGVVVLGIMFWLD